LGSLTRPAAGTAHLLAGMARPGGPLATPVDTNRLASPLVGISHPAATNLLVDMARLVIPEVRLADPWRPPAADRQ
jgi:hypothetical protein